MYENICVCVKINIYVCYICYGIVNVCQNFKAREIHLGQLGDRLADGMIQETKTGTIAVWLPVLSNMLSNSESNLSSKPESSLPSVITSMDFFKQPRLPDTCFLPLDWSHLSHPGKYSGFSDGAVVMNVLETICLIYSCIVSGSRNLLTLTSVPSIFKA